MRHQPTEVEDGFWQILRHRRLDGHKFRRQHPIGHYIVDFVCLSSRLIVELDGTQHAENAYDAARDAYLRSQGFRMMRVWNSDVLFRQDSVLEAIWATLQEPSP